MLADQVVKYGIDQGSYDRLLTAPVLKRVATAQKYVLDPQFTAVADALSSDYGSLVRAFPFCRLPYPETWFEVAHLDRPHFATAALHAPALQIKPKRVGFLCSATRDDLSAWITHLFWSIPGYDSCNGAGMAVRFDMRGGFSVDRETSSKLGDKLGARWKDLFAGAPIEDHPGWRDASQSVRDAVMSHTNPCAAEYGMPEMPSEIILGGPRMVEEFYAIFADLARSDWAGEISFLLAVIGLLNARNASETQRVEYGRKNKARIKEGKPPLFDHHVLKIHKRQETRVYGTGKPHADHGPMRLHCCSGHWKVRKSGIYFWRPHWRGSAARGMTTKDYQLGVKK